MKHKIRKNLLSIADENYRIFSSSLLPNVKNILGVRLPLLRKLAKQIYKSDNWQFYLKSNDDLYMEEILLKAFLIGLIDSTDKNIFSYIEDFVPKIDNWSICDSFCSSLKFAKQNQEKVLNFIQKYFQSEKEFEVRFALVMLLNYFVDEKYIEDVFLILDKINNDGYYAKMAVAWTVSVCFAKFPDKTLNYLKNNNLSTWVFNKSIQKCLESNKVSNDLKVIIRRMKR